MFSRLNQAFLAHNDPKSWLHGAVFAVGFQNLEENLVFLEVFFTSDEIKACIGFYFLDETFRSVALKTHKWFSQFPRPKALPRIPQITILSFTFDGCFTRTGMFAPFHDFSDNF